MKAAKFLAQCSSSVPGCHLEQPLSQIAWKQARAKAAELDIMKGDVPGLYPYKWQNRHDSEDTVIFYFYDFPMSEKVGFFAYLEATGKIHIGIFDTTDKAYQSIDQRELYSLNVTFRAELLGIISAKYQVQVG